GRRGRPSAGWPQRHRLWALTTSPATKARDNYEREAANPGGRENMNTKIGRMAAIFLSIARGWTSPRYAGVQKFAVDQTATVMLSPAPLNSSIPGAPVSYTIYQGRIFGALDPNDPHNSVITDIKLAPKTNGKVGYIANFQIVTPTKASDRSGLLIYGVS